MLEINARHHLEECCGSTFWVNRMMDKRPFLSIDKMEVEAINIWSKVNESDALEAFARHPEIGDITSLEKKYATTFARAGDEQKSVSNATRKTLIALEEGNRSYQNKFGFIFIVCATGKTADEMLSLLQQRLHNDLSKELEIAKKEQQKITRFRIQKMFI